MKFVLLPTAKDDLNQIRQYLQQESPAAARSVAVRIKKSLLLLTEQPHIGHQTDDDEVLDLFYLDFYKLFLKTRVFDKPCLSAKAINKIKALPFS